LVIVNQVATEKPNISNASHSAFLSQFSKCFVWDLPPGFPSSRPEDHRNTYSSRQCTSL